MNKIYNEILSKNLKYYMAIRGKTRNNLANDLDIPYSSIRDYEKGICYAKMDKLEKIANYFEIPVEKLIKDHNSANTVGVIEENEDSKLMYEIMVKLSKLNKDGKKYISKTIDMVSNDEQ